MKRCPQCNSLYEDSVQFCLNDGKPLIAESFSLPSDEEDTIIRHEPITINIPAPDENFAAVEPFPVENVVVVPAQTVSATRNYALFLIIGLLLGGGLVLATLLLSRNYFQTANVNSVNSSANFNSAANIVKPKTTTEAANASANANLSAVETSPAKHAAPNDEASDGLFNGHVIVANARVRRDPGSNAPVVDTLPLGDRLDIIDRAAPKSPWYLVECEHGATGWMHGDTIEFTKGNF